MINLKFKTFLSKKLIAISIFCDTVLLAYLQNVVGTILQFLLSFQCALDQEHTGMKVKIVKLYQRHFADKQVTPYHKILILQLIFYLRMS